MVIDVGWCPPRLIAHFLNKVFEEALDLWLLQVWILRGLALAQRLVGIATVTELFDGAMDLADAVVEPGHL